jgi:hypothetical protein
MSGGTWRTLWIGDRHVHAELWSHSLRQQFSWSGQKARARAQTHSQQIAPVNHYLLAIEL